MSPLEFLQRRFDEIGHVTAGSGVTITFAEYTETLQQFSTIRQLVDRLEGELAKTDNELAAAQAEARELRAELARVSARADRYGATLRVILKRGHDHISTSRLQMLAQWNYRNASEVVQMLEADRDALSQPAEQHDPLAVSDHCGECGEPEPECACDERESLPLMARDTCTNCGGTGVGGYHVHAPQEDAVEALRCEACDGFGFIEHGPKDCPATAPELPLMARREWRESVAFATVNQGAITGVFDRYDAAARSATHHRACIYRIADTDEHGLPVIERTADMPKRAKYRLSWITQAGDAGGDVEYTDSLPLALEANRSGAVSERIEDYRESWQEGQGDD